MSLGKIIHSLLVIPAIVDNGQCMPISFHTRMVGLLILIPKPNFVLYSQSVILIVGFRLLTYTDPVFVILISSLFGQDRRHLYPTVASSLSFLLSLTLSYSYTLLHKLVSMLWDNSSYAISCCLVKDFICHNLNIYFIFYAFIDLSIYD